MAFNVLVVDDSAVMRRMVIRVLRMSGIHDGSIREAANGEEGLALLGEQKVDLVLLDINMPVMNGVEMLGRIRANTATRELPVIVVSTEGSETRLQEMQQMGASIVRKPFAPETLRDTIMHIMGVSNADFCRTTPVSGDGHDF